MGVDTVNFDVPPALRQASSAFTSSSITLPSGYSQIQWSLDIPNQGDYENTNNSFVANLLTTPPSGSQGVGGTSSWQGGPVVIKGVNDPPPTIQFDITGFPVESDLAIQIVINNAMTIGISNGSLS